MITTGIIGAVLLAGLLHLETGISPLGWGARALLWLDAALICAWRCGNRAAREWWRRLPSVLAEVKAEVGR